MRENHVSNQLFNYMTVLVHAISQAVYLFDSVGVVG